MSAYSLFFGLNVNAVIVIVSPMSMGDLCFCTSFLLSHALFFGSVKKEGERSFGATISDRIQVGDQCGRV